MIRFAGKHGSLWKVRSPRAHYPRLGREVTVDVAIVGGGITGLTAAWLLKMGGKRVAVLELNEVGGGSTGSSSGHLAALPDRPLERLLGDFGEEGARTALRSGQEAIDLIESIAATGANSGFERVPGFRFTEEEDRLSELRKEAELAAHLGLPAVFTESVPVPFPVKGAIRVDQQAQIDPVLYLETLVERVAGEGSHVFEHTRVEQIQDGAPCTVVAGSHSVRARTVIEATHTPLHRSLGIQSRVEPRMSYVLALRLKGTIPRALLWDTSEPYHYLRRARDESGEYLLVGGEDHKTGQEADPVGRLEALLDYSRRRFPVESVAWSWSHQLFESVDGLPFVGRKPGQDHVLVAGGYSGTGLTFGTMAGALLSALAQGIEPPAAALYSPSRIKPLASAKEFLRENLNVAWHLVADRLRSPKEEGSAPLRPCQGRIMDLDGRKVAVYLDETRQLHVLSPVCPHAGGIVSWNDLEKSWDCPCHGGRFSPTGKVLCSPPTEDLECIPEPSPISPTIVGP
jgi:glycine/D-amino acid oxidase-like deaminating enzyme/nitrite reductase/ring-hydroxylating ferredoxin subunit